MAIRQRLILAGASMLLTAAGSLAYMFEGEVKATYLDPVGIPTVCVGHTGAGVIMGKVFNTNECTETFIKDLRTAEKYVNLCLPKMPEGAKPALISFTFNIGGGALCKSTLAKYANAGQFRAACGEILRWNKAGGKVLPGLIKRRKVENAECLGGL